MVKITLGEVDIVEAKTVVEWPGHSASKNANVGIDVKLIKSNGVGHWRPKLE